MSIWEFTMSGALHLRRGVNKHVPELVCMELGYFTETMI